MAFNPYGGFYPSFQPMYQPQQQNAIQPQISSLQASQDERIWVQSQAAAEAYLVAPNSFVRLWDSSAPVFYERRADASGRPFPMEVYEYKRRDINSATNTNNELLTRINELNMRVNELEKQIGGHHDTESDAVNQSV